MDWPVVNELKAAAVACPWGSHHWVALGCKEDTASSYYGWVLKCKCDMRGIYDVDVTAEPQLTSVPLSREKGLRPSTL